MERLRRFDGQKDKRDRRQVSCNLVVRDNAGRPRIRVGRAPDFYPDNPHAGFCGAWATSEE